MRVEHEIRDLEESVNEKGQKCCSFKMGKYTVEATFLNQPSEQAIKETIQTYYELFHKFNPGVLSGRTPK